MGYHHTLGPSRSRLHIARRGCKKGQNLIPNSLKEHLNNNLWEIMYNTEVGDFIPNE